MAERIHGEVNAPDIGDLLQYFEDRGRALDDEGQHHHQQQTIDMSTLQFISLIKFNGVPILPPVLTKKRREEMLSYKQEAVHREQQALTKKKNELHAKLQSIVAGVEERKAAKQSRSSPKTSRSLLPTHKSTEKRATTEVITKAPSKVATQPGVNVPTEIVVSIQNVDGTENTEIKLSKARDKSGKKFSEVTKSKSSQAACHRTTDSKKPTSYKSLVRIGNLAKQKSYSSQNLHSHNPLMADMDASTNYPKSKALLPHPPEGRPPTRGSSLRQSISTPDLRNIDISVKKEDLRQPLPSRSRSPTGGRPQTARKKATDSKVISKVEDKPKNTSDKSVNKQVSQQKENIQMKLDSKDVMSKEQTSKTDTAYKKPVENAGARMTDVSQQKPKVNPMPKYLQNPIEVSEQDLTKEDEKERNKKFGKQNTHYASTGDVRQDIDPIKTAAADLFPYLICEKQALATLDSLHSDFASLEQYDCLPKNYNGIPLTSLKEQQIIYMLTKLSKALNMEDTCTFSSNVNSALIGDLKADKQQEDFRGQSSMVENNCVPNGAYERSSGYFEPIDTDYLSNDSSENVTHESSNTGPSSSSFQNTSASSSHSRARMSPTGSSILSAASSVSGNRSRMSPKLLKNTVHFSSLVTEISTGASQSSFEDKISYRKLDITPKTSENFEEDIEGNDNESKNLDGSGSKNRPNLFPPAGNNMLSKVSLSHSIDSTLASPVEFHTHNLCEHNNQDGELNTSDKENEFVHEVSNNSDENYSGDRSIRTGRNPQVLNVYMANIPLGPVGENHPAVLKSSVKSDSSEISTLKRSQDKLLQENHSNNIAKDGQFYYNSGVTDFDIYLQGNIVPQNGIHSTQEEITRSYLISQGKQDVYELNENEKSKNNRFFSTNPNMEFSPVFLKPVIYSNSQTSLKTNRSFFEEEDQIRNNLKNVQLLESFSSETIHDIDKEERECATVIDKVEKNIEKKESRIDGRVMEMRNNELGIGCPIDNGIAQEDCKRENDVEEVIFKDSFDHGDDNMKIENHLYENSIKMGLQNCHDGQKMAIVNEEMEDDTTNVQKQQIKSFEQVTSDSQILRETIRSGQYEEEAKAEHMQRYLSHVHEQSLRNEDEFNSNDNETKCPDVMDTIGALIQSFTSNIQSMNHLSQEDLFRIQTEQFEVIQQKLIEHQRAQLEELFVSQRKEQMGLQQEIEAYGMRLKQTDLETIPDQLSQQTSEPLPQATQAWQHQPSEQVSALSPPFPIQPVPYVPPFFHNQNWNILPYNNSYTHVPYPYPRVTMGINHPFGLAQGFDANLHNTFLTHPDDYLCDISHNSSYSSIPHVQPMVPQGNWVQNMSNNVSHDAGASQSSNPFIYPSSPSLYMNPKDRDNASDVSGLAKATPKQLVFSNQSTPVPVKVYKPIEHSPIKKVVTKMQSDLKRTLRDKIFDLEMQHKFDRVSAVVKGYLTRRLLGTPRVQEIINKLNDTRNFAFSFQGETPVKNGKYSREDMDLLARIVAQLQAALLDIHEIFFVIPVAERMAIISAARQLEQERWFRESDRSLEGVSKTHPKLSKVTMKVLERKRKSLMAEEFGSVEFHSKSIPPITSSPHTSADIRVLRPLQGQISPIHPDSPVTVREIKQRPTSAQEKKTDSGNKSKKHSGHKTSRVSSTNGSTKQKTANVKPTKKTDKAWR